MPNVVLLRPRYARPSVSPAVKAEAIAWLLRERDATARTMAKLRAEINRLDATLADITGYDKENEQ